MRKVGVLAACMVAVWMAPRPNNVLGLRYRHTVDALVNQAIVD